MQGPFGRMGNVNWVILGFRSEKCTQIFLGPRTSDFRPDYGDFLYKRSKRQFFLYFCTIFSRIFGICRGPREAALAADLITARKSRQGGCASSRLDHGLKVFLNPYMNSQKNTNINRFVTIFSAFFQIFGR